MRDSLIIGIFVYILMFGFVAALLPNYFFVGSTVDAAKVVSDAQNSLGNVESDDVLSISKIKNFFKIFFASPTISGIPSLIGWIILLINYSIIFILVIYGYNKIRGIGGS